MTFRLLWPTRSRSGSQFIVKLTRSLYGASLGKVSLVNGARKDTAAKEDTIGDFAQMLKAGQGLAYVRDNGIAAMKYEDPGKDDFVIELMDAYPEARAVTSYRRIEDIISSHYNIRRWGHNEADILYQFSASLSVYRRLFERGQLFMVNVDSPGTFSLDQFAAFLGTTPTRAATDIVAQWEPTNTLEYQQEKHDGGVRQREIPPRIRRLREIHPWVNDVEREYLGMCSTLPSSAR